MNQGQKMLLDFAPLLAFFLGNYMGGIYWGTGIFMLATVVVLAITYMATGKVAKFPLFSAVFVGLFGALTLYLQNDVFIKVKVTLINILFGSILLGGLAFGKTLLKDVMGDSVNLPQQVWRSLTLRWAFFFFALAGLNEYVWRHTSTDNWVTFKVFGLMGLTLVFALANAPLMMKHMTDTDENPSANG